MARREKTKKMAFVSTLYLVWSDYVMGMNGIIVCFAVRSPPAFTKIFSTMVCSLGMVTGAVVITSSLFTCVTRACSCLQSPEKICDFFMVFFFFNEQASAGEK